MFDSFAGLPPVEGRDGPAALAWQRDTTSPYFYDNCTAPLAQVRAAVQAFGFSDEEAIVVPGWFHETLPQQRARIAERGIALLRVDCDWYKPVYLVLEQLVPIVSEEGTIIIDDYFFWDGCARATHAYLAAQDLAYRIRSLPSFSCAWMVKRAGRVGEV